MSYAPSPNFAFLAGYDARLVAAPTSAERALAIDDAVGALIHLRRFGEHLAKNAAAEYGVHQGERTDQIDRLRDLKRRGADEGVIQMFQTIRMVGNKASHDGYGSQSDAFHHLKLAHQLAIWFYKFVNHSPGFNPGPFVPPKKLIGDTAELRKEIEDLNAEAEAREEERDEALEAVEAERKKRLGAEEAAKRVEEERVFLEAYAAEQDAEVSKNKAALAEAQAKIAALEAKQEAVVAERQAVIAKAPAAEVDKTIRLSNEAAAAIDLDEASTRRLIDQQLRSAGWEAHSTELRYSQGSRPQKGKNQAIAEWPTDSGPADYVLFLGLKAVGVVEAKRKKKDVASALEQSKRYSEGFKTTEGIHLDGPWGSYKIPFLFASNGRPFLEQLRTKSGIWHIDIRRPTNLSKPLHDWPSPDGLKQRLRQDLDAANEKLGLEPTDYLGLRDYQVHAIQAVEAAIEKEQDKLLVAMATGTGKTRTAIGLVYRLLKANRFRRILFLVDRSSLGEQTTNAFDEVEIENLLNFGQIFGIDSVWLNKNAKRQDGVAIRLTVSTVQGMVHRIFDEANPEAAPKVDDYDCVIVDECHRGYGLDQELTDAELSLSEYGIRSQDDYISKYRRVLEHFDAVKIGLTATPAKHTAAIFGRPVVQYTYREAVIDGHLIDHEPPINITTRLAEEGIHLDRGEQVQLFNPGTVNIDLVDLEDELDFEITAFNKRVLNDNFNRVVCEELAQHIDPELPEKTLIFAATDLHADQVVEHLKKAFEAQYGSVEDGMVVKITGAADKPLSLIRRFKNERNPKVVVTVDLLTTGIDVPTICNLVFLRRVKSRILYDQMIGRATRQCDEIGKETFRIYDAVGLYESLQDVTQMKPVVTLPNVSFPQLVEELERAVAEVPELALQQEVLDQIVAKLQRKKKRLKGQELELFQATAQMSPDELADRLRKQSPSQALDYFKNNELVLKVLSTTGPSPGVYLSDAADEVLSVTKGYGAAKRPEDYLDSFAKYVNENINTLPALTVVAQRPRDLTRKQLKELEIELSTKGFTEASLRSAWSDTKNEDIAASVVGFVRQAALGDPLKNYAERVDQAVKKLMQKHEFNRVQKQWLERIAKQLKQETIVDRAALNSGRFATDGGFERFNKVFDGKLEMILGDLQESIWETSA